MRHYHGLCGLCLQAQPLEWQRVDATVNATFLRSACRPGLYTSLLADNQLRRSSCSKILSTTNY